jgi:hypothetical protein
MKLTVLAVYLRFSTWDEADKAVLDAQGLSGRRCGLTAVGSPTDAITTASGKPQGAPLFFLHHCDADRDHRDDEGLDLALAERDHGADLDELPLCYSFAFRQPIKLCREPDHLLADKIILH